LSRTHPILSMSRRWSVSSWVPQDRRVWIY